MRIFAKHDRWSRWMPVPRHICLHSWKYLCLTILLTSSISSGAAETTGPKNGTLLIVGGGDRNKIVFNEFVELAGGKEAKIVFVPTASSSDPDYKYMQNRLALFARQKLGMNNITVVHTHNRAEADTEEFVRPIREADAIWFSGGRQWRIADAYLGTLAEQEFQAVLDRGGVIGGSSAGATIQGSFLVRGDTSGSNVLIGDHQVGFGYINNAAIDQHVIPRRRQKGLIEVLTDPDDKMDPTIDSYGLLGIGIDEATGIVVRGNEFTVTGKEDGVVLLYDARKWNSDTAEEDKHVELWKGARYDMKNRIIIDHGNPPVPKNRQWKYSADLLQPFWLTDVVESESVLFTRDSETKAAEGTLLFPIDQIIAIHNAAGDITYREGVDYRFQRGTRTIVIPTGSRIVTTPASELRRPANSQQHQLTHRDGNGEILFGAKLEYHQMQTFVTYKKESSAWPVTMPTFDVNSLPITIKKLRDGKDVSIVLLGDSISTGCNASGWGNGPPHQPPYPGLLVHHLQACYRTNVTLTNLSVGGTSTPWGITMVDKVVKEQPDLVLLAFGMNDSAGLTAEQYGQNVATMIAKTRDQLPDAEFVLIASMLGNRNWIRLNHDVFPQYRDQLAKQSGPGIALADMTSVWQEFLNRKKDSDLTGNGVNHPNDFGHRVYAQVLSELLVDPRPASR